MLFPSHQPRTTAHLGPVKEADKTANPKRRQQEIHPDAHILPSQGNKTKTTVIRKIHPPNFSDPFAIPSRHDKQNPLLGPARCAQLISPNLPSHP
ncbi:hypothetical protein VTJ04DRAFT_8124 [Mycothermus thermophilus]|uniref:uncharacterized protein n=1 Tax=Humicola insolens TaxID=85995 RepID=UPI003743DFCE